jgi:DNA-binding NtrC family response regulator
MQEALQPILIVDDEHSLLSYLRQVLSEKFRVLTAPDAATAEAILAKNTDVKVVLCDHEMPGEKGLDFLARLRKLMPKVQRILMTAHARPEVFLKAINEGDVLKFLVKPATPQDVCDAVELGMLEHGKAEEAEAMESNLDAMREKMKSLPWLAHRFQMITQNSGSFLLASIKVMVFGAAVALGLGALVIFVLYLLKSYLGIDIMGELHFGEFLEKLVE